jgi:hypothetical protein
MKPNSLLSATVAITLTGSTAAFAQSGAYSQPSDNASVLTLKPGQTVGTATPGDVASHDATSASATQPHSDVGIVTLKPGNTVYTAPQSSLGSVTAGATAVPAR